MPTYLHILSAAGGLVFGIAAAMLNAHLTKKRLHKDGLGAVTATNTLRMVVDIAAMAIAFLAVSVFDLPLMTTLVAVAIGLTVAGTIFLVRITKLEAESSKKKNGGDA